ncbi:hypothetical protein SH661x_004217 [Planctomicrobium sp. SH661]|uniref:hypothetical protein n=1 Tax=Planctomicrobium sp. SH661 TaxID=3448124 RepID=UPI003F5CA02F
MTSTVATPAGETQGKLSARPSPKYLWLAVGIVVVWVGLVAVLAWLTANPVTLNRQQIRDSLVVVEGQMVIDRTNNPVRYLIEPVSEGPWPFPSRDPIEVSNLPETGATQGKSYFFPLAKHHGRVPAPGEYIVTPTRLPNAAPLVYPATEDARQQLKQILSEKGDADALRPRLPAVRD